MAIDIPSIEERLESFLSWKDHCPTYLKRGVELDPNNNICFVKTTFDGEQAVDKSWHYGANLVTNDGDIYYAVKAQAQTSLATNEDFGDNATARLELRTGSATPAKADTYTSVTTPVTASRKKFDTNYPTTNDQDSDNTGAGLDVVTYLTSWTTTDFNATGIIGGCVHENASPVSATKLLTHFSIASFDKTASDTLKVFINHTMNGV
jgi:hypothetical protein